MAVFMEKHTARAAPTQASPPLRARTMLDRPEQGCPSYNDAAAPTPGTPGCSSMHASAVAKTSPTPPAQATSGAPSSTSCSRRWSVTPTHKSSTARAATPRRAHASTRVPGPLQYGPASRPYVVHLLIATSSNASHNMHALIARPARLGYQLHRRARRSNRHRSPASPDRTCTSIETSAGVDRANLISHSAGTTVTEQGAGASHQRGCEAMALLIGGLTATSRRCRGGRLLGVAWLCATSTNVVRRAPDARACLHRPRPTTVGQPSTLDDHQSRPTTTVSSSA